MRLPESLKKRLLPVPSMRHKLLRPGPSKLPRLPEATSPRVVLVMHDAPGGVHETTRDLVRELYGSFELLGLLANPYGLRLVRYGSDGQYNSLGGLRLPGYWQPFPRRRTAYRQAYGRFLSQVRPDAVHVRHLLGHTLDLVDNLEEAGIPWAASIHDFYLVCPSIHLLDEQGRFCGGVRCTPGEGRCPLPVSWLGTIDDLKHVRVEEWKEENERALSGANRLIFASSSSAELFGRVFPKTRSRTSIIEHGSSQAIHRTSPTDELRVLVLGNLLPHKGRHWLQDVVEAADEAGVVLQWHSLGTPADRLKEFERLEHFTVWGSYKRDDLSVLMQRIRPNLAFLPSTWPETFGHVLSECWSYGLPAIVGDLGAFADRVTKTGAGWVVPTSDAQAVVRVLEHCSSSKELQETMRAAAQQAAEGLVTVAAMADSYRRLYADLIRQNAPQRAACRASVE